jgi:hypothetical protein
MHKTLTWLVPLIAGLALIAALAGLFLPGGNGPFTFTSLRGHEVEMFGRGLYQYDTLLVGAALRGTDAVTLLVSLPLLVLFTWRARRGSPNAPLAFRDQSSVPAVGQAYRVRRPASTGMAHAG